MGSITDHMDWLFFAHFTGIYCCDEDGQIHINACHDTGLCPYSA
jgi:hypothetical protein